jgi:RHS repeat-associated protein
VINSGATNLVTMSYDGLGRRTSIVQKLNNVQQTNNKFLFEGLFPVQKRNSAGSTVVSEYFAQGQKDGSTKHFFTKDHLGDIRESSNNSGVLETRFDYAPYGAMTKVSGTYLPDWGFQNMQVLRVGTKVLNLTWGRIYDPDYGIWLGKDPIREAGGLNLYSAFGGDPINESDRLGLAFKPGKTPPGKWPPPPPDVVGKNPKWNPKGFWEGKGGDISWDDRSHGSGVDRGEGGQDGHWDDANSDKRWDRDGNLLPYQDPCPVDLPVGPIPYPPSTFDPSTYDYHLDIGPPMSSYDMGMEEDGNAEFNLGVGLAIGVGLAATAPEVAPFVIPQIPNFSSSLAY